MEGLPEEGLISPTLFHIFINDILKTQQTQIALYVDDTTFASRKRENTTRQYIHHHLQLLTHKTQFTIFTHRKGRKRDPVPLTFDGKILQEVTSVKNLGVTLDYK